MSLQGSPSKYHKNALPQSPSQNSNKGTNENENKSERQSKKRFCWTNFKDFSSCTSLHGIQYVGESKRSIFERFWWLIMVVLSFATCVYMIYRIWKKWEESPVIVSFAETSMPVWQIPFPAVTICSEIRVRQTVYNYTEAYKKRKWDNLTQEEIFDMESVGLMCNKLVSSGSKHANASNIEFLKRTAQPEDKLFSYCDWKHEIYGCENLFSPIFTEEGRCFSFNILDGDELFTSKFYNDLNSSRNGKESDGWTIDSGYSHVKINAFPERGIVSGVGDALEIWLSTDDNDTDYLCSDSTQGFKISLHSPADFPRVSQQYFMVPVGQEIIAAIKPNMITTSSGLKSYDPHRRQCFRTEERQLKYFQIYTKQNCEMECLSNYTFSACGCVAFWMPKDEKTPICSAVKKPCMEEAQNDLRKLEIMKALALKSNNTGKFNRLGKTATQCDCLPGCTSLNYDVEVSQSDFRWKELADALEITNKMSSTVQYSKLRLFFKDSDFITSKRSELYGVTDFLANCGGVLGLFLGFSFLSLVEIFYFLTIRPMINLKRKVKLDKNVPQSSWDEP